MTQDQIDRIRAYCEKATPGFQEMASACYDLRLLLQYVEQLRRELAVKQQLIDKRVENAVAQGMEDIVKLQAEELEQLREERDTACDFLVKARRLIHNPVFAEDNRFASESYITSAINTLVALHPTSNPA